MRSSLCFNPARSNRSWLRPSRWPKRACAQNQRREFRALRHARMKVQGDLHVAGDMKVAWFVVQGPGRQHPQHHRQSAILSAGRVRRSRLKLAGQTITLDRRILRTLARSVDRLRAINVDAGIPALVDDHLCDRGANFQPQGSAGARRGLL